ncbi:MAG TPA: endolytic transglycosylase MltG [Candidatus Limnocylindria bacterium]|nr:endolytic transglycosylase MltG [Candidatus Limnocylindria bacterium]
MQDVRGGGYRPRRTNGSDGGGGVGLLTRLLVIASAIGVLIIVAYLIFPPLFGGFFRGLAEDNPDLMRLPFVADAVREEIGDRLDQPAGTDPTPVDFVIAPGASSRQITDELVNRELVTDRLAFSFLLITEGAGSRLRAGAHVLDRTMSPREVVAVLERVPDAGPPKVTVSLREGLRIEQVTAYLQTLELTDFDAEAFFGLLNEPPAELRADYDWLRVVPEDRSLEGFIGSGVFEVGQDISAEEMARTLLDRWQQSGALALLEQAEREGTDFYHVVRLASLVQREARLASERPLIAGVYQNRLDGLGDGTRLLNADPTVIYAKDTMRLREMEISEWPQYFFWTYEGIATFAGFRVADDLATYQTWHSRGLQAGPICTPSLSSIEAAMAPDTEDGYVYFVAAGDDSHLFARTYEEHLANIERVRGSPAPASPMPETPAP